MDALTKWSAAAEKRVKARLTFKQLPGSSASAVANAALIHALRIAFPL
jgi:hypothetical protein